MVEDSIFTFKFSDLKNGFHKEELRKSIVEHGLFYIEDYGISETDHELPRNVALDFFLNGTNEEKIKVTNTIPNVRRGFSQLEKESTAQITNSGTYTDYSMCYSMGIGNNLFPTTEFQDVWTKYFNEMYGKAKEICKLILSEMGSPKYDNIDELVACDPVMRFRHFPEVPEERCKEIQPLRMAPHYDISLITLIHQTPCSNGFVSLQSEIKGEYVDVPFKPGKMIVMCGAVLPLLTDGKAKAPKHRVCSPALHQRVGSSRTSLIFFMRPKSNFEIDIPLAKSCGIDITLSGPSCSFGKWMGGNYLNLETNASTKKVD